MKYALLLAGFSIATPSLAACKYSLDKKYSELKWTGYKTPKKAPVSGTVEDIKLSPGLPKASALEALDGLEFSINLASASSGDKVRDTRIAKLLFKDADQVVGRYVKSDKTHLYFDITTNKVTKSVALAYEIKDTKLSASGYLDLLDFSLQKNLKVFAEACKGRHEGKSWTDVKTDLKLKFYKTCK